MRTEERRMRTEERRMRTEKRRGERRESGENGGERGETEGERRVITRRTRQKGTETEKAAAGRHREAKKAAAGRPGSRGWEAAPHRYEQKKAPTRRREWRSAWVPWV